MTGLVGDELLAVARTALARRCAICHVQMTALNGGAEPPTPAAGSPPTEARAPRQVAGRFLPARAGPPFARESPARLRSGGRRPRSPSLSLSASRTGFGIVIRPLDVTRAAISIGADGTLPG